MFGFKKKKPASEAEHADTPDNVDDDTPKAGLFSRLKKGLSKTGSSITSGMGNLFLGKKAIDDDILEELETRLLMADVGIEATQSIIKNLRRIICQVNILKLKHLN